MRISTLGKITLAALVLVSAAAFTAGKAMAQDTLARNASLRAPGQLKSEDGRYTLDMQEDGNLVVYNAQGRAEWSSDTVGRGAVECVMQSDGNLVLKDRNGRSVWSTLTEGAKNARLMIQNDGNLVIYNGRGFVVWAKGRVRDSLSRDEKLVVDEFLRSQNRKYTLILQGDGNLVVRDERGKGTWSSNTVGSGAGECVMQGDGNLVLKDRSGKSVWSSRTEGHDNARLLMQDNGQAVIFSEASEVLWTNGNLGPAVKPRPQPRDEQGVDSDSLAYRAKTGDDEFDRSLNNLNRVAERYPEDFTNRLSREFGVSKVWIDGLLKSEGLPPADVYMLAKTAAVTNRTLSAVERVYKANRVQGWGVIAQRLGIQPGSEEFRLLKKDEAGFLSTGRGQVTKYP